LSCALLTHLHIRHLLLLLRRLDSWLLLLLWLRLLRRPRLLHHLRHRRCHRRRHRRRDLLRARRHARRLAHGRRGSGCGGRRACHGCQGQEGPRAGQGGG
jgi:hypothetical protein